MSYVSACNKLESEHTLHFRCYKFKFKGFKKVVAKCACTIDLYCLSSATRLNRFVPLSAGMEDKSGLTEHEWDLEFHG